MLELQKHLLLLAHQWSPYILDCCFDLWFMVNNLFLHQAELEKKASAPPCVGHKTLARDDSLDSFVHNVCTD